MRDESPLLLLLLPVLAPALPSLWGLPCIGGGEARETTARTDARVLTDEVTAFVTRNGRWPALSELTRPDARGRRELDELPVDPWGHDFVLRFGELLPQQPWRAFEVVSAGPDGRLGTPDDIPSRRPPGR